MANRTQKEAKSVRGTNPQYLVEKIIRTRAYDTRYWKEECFALTGSFFLSVWATVLITVHLLIFGDFKNDYFGTLLFSYSFMFSKSNHDQQKKLNLDFHFQPNSSLTKEWRCALSGAHTVAI